MNSEDHYLKRELYELVRTDAALFEFLQAGSLDGIWYWDLEAPEVEWMSPRFWDVFGYDPADKKHFAAEWQDMIHPDDLQTALDNFNKHAADPSHPYDQIVRYLHKDGSTVWVRCRGLIIRDAEGNPRRMLGAHNEVTALKKAEEELRIRNAELQAANDELERFASVASHDLQEPLRKIVAFSELLEMELGDDIGTEAKRHLDRVTDGARRMSRLIHDILELSRTGRVEIDLRETALDACVDGALAAVAQRVEESGAVVDRQSLPTLPVDARHLERVFLNLLSNAIKFAGDDPPHIIIDAEETDDAWRIRFADAGIGFDPKYAEQIFQSFRRLHSRGRYEGTGIGLAICRTILERHGGRIWAESVPDQGATFSLELPKTQAGTNT